MRRDDGAGSSFRRTPESRNGLWGIPLGPGLRRDDGVGPSFRRTPESRNGLWSTLLGPGFRRDDGVESSFRRKPESTKFNELDPGFCQCDESVKMAGPLRMITLLRIPAR